MNDIRRRRSPVWIILFVVVLLAAAENYLSRRSFPPEEHLTDLTDLQDKQVEVFTQRNALLTTLGTLVIAMFGWMWSPERKLTVSAVLSIGFAFASIILGVLSHNRLLWMLQNEFLNLENPQIFWASKLQFWTLLIAGGLMLDHARHV